jgi:hypothetical protein
VSLVRSRLLQECLFKEYATTRARRMISLKSVPHNDDNLGSAGECGLSFPTGSRVVFLLVLTASARSWLP